MFCYLRIELCGVIQNEIILTELASVLYRGSFQLCTISESYQSRSKLESSNACFTSCAEPIRSENTCSAPTALHFITWFYKR